MEKQNKKKITWTIKKPTYWQLIKTCYSDHFVVGGCHWRLSTNRSFGDQHLNMFLEVPDYESLPLEWSRRARFRLTIVNQNPLQHSKQKEVQMWFDGTCHLWGCKSRFELSQILAKDGGFLVNEELKIVAEVEVLQVTGKLDVSEKTSRIMETTDVYGFQLLSSQVENVSRMFERHPQMAAEFRPNNSNLRTGYMSLLISLIETLLQSPHDLHKTDLVEAYAALRFMTDAGFKLDWLKKKLDEMSDKKEKEEAGETQMLEIADQLMDLKLKFSNLKSQLEMKKSEVLAAKEPISFDDLI